MSRTGSTSTRQRRQIFPRAGGSASVIVSSDILGDHSSFMGEPKSRQRLYNEATNKKNNLDIRINKLCEWIKTFKGNNKHIAMTIQISIKSVLDDVNNQLNRIVEINDFKTWRQFMTQLKCLFQTPHIDKKHKEDLLKIMLKRLDSLGPDVYPTRATFFGWLYLYIATIDHDDKLIFIRELSEPIHLKYIQKIKNDDTKTQERKRTQLKQLFQNIERRSGLYTRQQFIQKLRRQIHIPDSSITPQRQQQPIQKTQTPDLSPTQKQSVQKLRQKPKTPLPSGFSFFGRQGGSHKKGQYESYTLFGEHGLFNIFPKESKVSTDAGTA